MQRKQFIKNIAIALTAPAVLLSACKQKGQAAVTDAKKQTYTCPMHPQIVQNSPGTCPICGMDLVPFDKNNTDDALQLSEAQQALAGITTTTVGTGSLSNFTQLNGRLVINPEATEYVSSRVPGRIEVLYFKELGVPVRKGQAVYKIYSEQLATLQQEYLLAVRQASEFPGDAHFQQILKASRQKLLLYNMSEAQIANIVKSQKTDPYVTYFAPASGVVAELSITEGQYVAEGATIMRIEGYGSLWVEADVYPSEAGNVRIGQQVKVIVPGWEDQPHRMTIQFITPALQSGTQLMQIRGSIPNVNGQWQPGLQANVLLPGKSAANALTLPVDAVIREQKGMHVWIEKEKGKYEPRMVTTGMETAGLVEITSGLAEGDKVVATGAYLLYSEFILKKGKNPMAGHNHG
ncbi:membrane fusion protein, Cu(I)/Ag(I) efflux system [Cnuella takakiae]|uniref:Membrane fusion protein, Cu(I)/Ag(I) efflux system n=1 Tax=Cnuella takakiae TaxID=1302690 RepID=A0A1M4SLA9_9BACT|nr:efflux RND transporter periplasmic adaptor subunit [Cnuella takakiae]OLY94532.1 efflux transporter periplasmic adaptor subunit [Cnuella takakiae]SHE32767.1 membrane fusion protein, Cu(I)/Ag(I) efflux system [Cnuella takakiae]